MCKAIATLEKPIRYAPSVKHFPLLLSESMMEDIIIDLCFLLRDSTTEK